MEQSIENTDPDNHQRAANAGRDGCKSKEVHAVGSGEHRKVSGTTDVAAAETCRDARFIPEQASKMPEEAGSEEGADDSDNDDDECTDREVLC